MAHYVEEMTKDLPETSRAMCQQLDELVHQAELDISEGKKWDFCAYWTDKGLVCGLGAAKAFVRLSFFDGAAMRDDAKLFSNGTDNAKARIIRFTDIGQINVRADDIVAYVKEAVQNLEKGRKTVVANRVLEIPNDLKTPLQQANLLAKFESLTYTEKKEIIASVLDAKKEETRIRRIEKTLATLR